MKQKFIQFLKLEKLLTEFTHNFQEHGFREGQTLDEYLDKTDYRNYISNAFKWGDTSRCEDSYNEGEIFYFNLVSRWVDFSEGKIKKTSDRQKIRKYIEVYLKAIDVGGEFSGTQLASYVLKRAGCPNRHYDTALRYLRQMKDEIPPKLNYKCVNREQSKYIKL